MIKILAYFIIPIYTLLFTRGYSWFTTNFSVIGNLVDKKLAFFIWGILVGGYFFLIFRKLKMQIDLLPACSKLIPAALILLFCAITTPYLPDEMPLKSFLHIVFAFLAAVLLLAFLFLVCWSQYRLFPGRYLPFLIGLAGIVSVSASLLVLVGIVSSILEIFVTFTTVIMAERLLSAAQPSSLLWNGRSFTSLYSAPYSLWQIPESDT